MPLTVLPSGYLHRKSGGVGILISTYPHDMQDQFSTHHYAADQAYRQTRQLRRVRQRIILYSRKNMVGGEGLEPPTFSV